MNRNHWQTIVRDHSGLVWQTIFRLLANESDAADCFQETFVSAWTFASNQPVKNWPGLLRTLATKRALDQLRRRQRDLKYMANGPNLNDLPSEYSGPLAMAQSAELAGQLRSALADLPEQLSEIYCLRHLNGLSYEEIAQELEMTTSAVGVNLHRATLRLRAALMTITSDEQIRGTP